MSLLRLEKIARIAQDIPEQEVFGPDSGDLLVISWGGTYGAVLTAVIQAQKEGKSVGHAHLRYLNPFPRNLEEIISHYKAVLVPELNLGQLLILLKTRFEFKSHAYHKIQGQPFKIREIKQKIDHILGEE
jgi:2-oxoglutarate ferredoxin oxidoreductase subunit alpha